MLMIQNNLNLHQIIISLNVKLNLNSLSLFINTIRYMLYLHFRIIIHIDCY